MRVAGEDEMSGGDQEHHWVSVLMGRDQVIEVRRWVEVDQELPLEMEGSLAEMEGLPAENRVWSPAEVATKAGRQEGWFDGKKPSMRSREVRVDRWMDGRLEPTVEFGAMPAVVVETSPAVK